MLNQSNDLRMSPSGSDIVTSSCLTIAYEYYKWESGYGWTPTSAKNNLYYCIVVIVQFGNTVQRIRNTAITVQVDQRSSDSIHERNFMAEMIILGTFLTAQAVVSTGIRQADISDPLRVNGTNVGRLGLVLHPWSWTTQFRIYYKNNRTKLFYFCPEDSK